MTKRVFEVLSHKYGDYRPMILGGLDGWGLCSDESGLHLLWNEEIMGRSAPTQEELAAWEMELPSPVEQAKYSKIAAIDARTDALLVQYGMPFGGSNFSLTDKARLNYREVESALANATDFRDMGYMSVEDFTRFFPVSFQTLDGVDYTFSNPLELQSFFLALGTYQANTESPWATGRALKTAVSIAITIEEVEAVVDDRE